MTDRTTKRAPVLEHESDTPQRPTVPAWLNLDALDLDEALVERIANLLREGRALVTQVLDFTHFASKAIDDSGAMARRSVGNDDLDALHAVLGVVTGTQELFDLCQMIGDAGVDVTGSSASTYEAAQRLRDKYGFADRAVTG